MILNEYLLAIIFETTSPLMVEYAVLEIKQNGFDFVGNGRLALSAILGSIISLVLAIQYPSSLLLAIPSYAVIRIVLNKWLSGKRANKRITRPDYPENMAHELNYDLFKSELAKLDNSKFEFVLIEGKSPDTHWLQIAKDKHGYLLNFSSDLITGHMHLPENSPGIKFKDLGKTAGNRVIRLICNNPEYSARAIYSLLKGLSILNNIYHIEYE